MRAMVFEFTDDPTCDYLDRQYMLGESILVAPIFSENSIVKYYIPNVVDQPQTNENSRRQME